MIYRLDTDTLIYMIRGLKSSNRHQASRDRAQKLVARCRQAQADGDVLAVSATNNTAHFARVRGLGVENWC